MLPTTCSRNVQLYCINHFWQPNLPVVTRSRFCLSDVSSGGTRPTPCHAMPAQITCLKDYSPGWQNFVVKYPKSSSSSGLCRPPCGPCFSALSCFTSDDLPTTLMTYWPGCLDVLVPPLSVRRMQVCSLCRWLMLICSIIKSDIEYCVARPFSYYWTNIVLFHRWQVYRPPVMPVTHGLKII